MGELLTPEPVLPRRRTAALFWLLLVLVSVGLLEGALWVASIGFLRRSARALVYSPPAVTKEGYSTYLQQRDPVLGWPSPTSFGVGDLDHSGARRTPSFPTPGTACVVAYGDSFTFGTDADNEHAWSNVLSNLLGCRVANFGVPGYGVDQAYLRFEGVTESSSSIALLGIYPDNVLRNLNQYRFFLTGWEVFGLKPRFIWQDSTALVPLPRMSYEEFKAALRDPARGFPHEEFLPGSSFGQIPSRFPLTAHMIRGLFSDNIVLRVRDRPRWVEFVRPSHDSHAFEITLDIVRRFARTAEDREMAPAVILFPSHRSQVGYRETGRSMMSDVQDSIRAAGVPVLDLTPGLDDFVGDRNIFVLFPPEGSCGRARDTSVRTGIASPQSWYTTSFVLKSGSTRRPARPKNRRIRLIYGHGDGALMGVPFDLETHQTTSSPVTLHPDLAGLRRRRIPV